MDFVFNLAKVEVSDVWVEIAAYLDLPTLAVLTRNWYFFAKEVMKKDTLVWKKNVLIELQMPDPGKVEFDWKAFRTHPDFLTIFDYQRIYTHYYDGHSASHSLLACRFFTSHTLRVAGELVPHASRIIEGIKPGIWIADGFTVFTLNHSDVYLTPGFEDLPRLELVAHETDRGDLSEEFCVFTPEAHPDTHADDFVHHLSHALETQSSQSGLFRFCGMKYALVAAREVPTWVIHYYDDRLLIVQYSFVRDDEGHVIAIRVEQHLVHGSDSDD